MRHKKLLTVNVDNCVDSHNRIVSFTSNTGFHPTTDNIIYKLIHYKSITYIKAVENHR